MSAPSKGAQEILHTAMWTLLGLMAIGLVLVPLVRPSILLTSLFFGWSNVMVAYIGWRIIADIHSREVRPVVERRVAPPVILYTYEPDAHERARPLRD